MFPSNLSFFKRYTDSVSHHSLIRLDLLHITIIKLDDGCLLVGTGLLPGAIGEGDNHATIAEYVLYLHGDTKVPR